MLQQRQIVKALDKYVNIEDPVSTKYAITDFHSIVWMFISIDVTIYRTVLIQRYQSTSHFIMLMTTKLLRYSI
jgi:hypothetical protein